MNSSDVLFKVVSHEDYAHEFLENGAILLRNLPWFRYIESKGVSTSFLKDIQQGGFYLGDYVRDSSLLGLEGIPFKKHGAIALELPEERNKYLFCLSVYHACQGHTLQINEQFLTFGDYAIVILDGEEFIRRFEDAVSHISETRSYMGHRVEYFDPPTLQGRKDLWRKESQFEWQSEYRFMWETAHIRDGEIMLHLGSLEDIARVFPTRELVKGG